MRKGWKDEKGWLGPGSLARLQEHGEMEQIEQIKGYVLKVTAKQLFDGMPPSCCNIAYFKVVLDGDERMRKVKVFGWELVVESAKVMNACEIRGLLQGRVSTGSGATGQTDNLSLDSTETPRDTATRQLNSISQLHHDSAMPGPADLLGACGLRCDPAGVVRAENHEI